MVAQPWRQTVPGWPRCGRRWGVDMPAVAKAGSTFFGYDGQFYFTTLLRAPNATVIAHEFKQALQLSQAAQATR